MSAEAAKLISAEVPAIAGNGRNDAFSHAAVLRLPRAHFRLHLQERSSTILRRHVQRAAVRFVVLVVADLLSFALMRQLVRAVQDHAVLGQRLADSFSRILPGALMDGWQFAVALLVALVVTGSYGTGDQRRSPRRLLWAAGFATALPFWMEIWTNGVERVALQYLLVVSLIWVGLMMERLLFDRAIEVVVQGAEHPARTVFVGPAEDCRRAMRSQAFESQKDYLPVGFVDTENPPASDSLGFIGDFTRLLAESNAESVVMCGYLNDGRFQEVADAALASGCELLSVPRAIEIAGVQPTLYWRAGQPFIELTAPRLKGSQLIVKRTMDIIGAAVGLALLSPLFVLLIILVKLDSAGPAFFRQERIGRGGRPFRIVKFRTMVIDAERKRDELLALSLYKDGRLFKIPDDPRVTRIGGWLRRTSLDELPQLFNVLLGEMSLVGPRPPVPSEVALYEARHYDRFDVKPGLSGPWQVNGRNRITDFEEILRLERAYIRQWSLLSDFGILLRTIPAVLRVREAH